MQMIFHPENPQGNTIIPNDEEQRHLRALRMEEGTQILVSNGSGTIFLCEAIILKKETHLNVISSTFHEQRQAFLEIAIAPTKNNDRLEWFVEKAVERHLQSDVEVGIFLSGGVDSSIITLLASDANRKENTKPLQTLKKYILSNVIIRKDLS